MGDRLKYERFLWFHGRVKARSYPNARILADEFELSSRMAQRDIEFMRDRLRAPLVYFVERKGYAYTDWSFELPGLLLTEDNVVAVALAVRLASSVPDERMKQNLCSFLDDLPRQERQKRSLLHRHRRIDFRQERRVFESFVPPFPCDHRSSAEEYSY